MRNSAGELGIGLVGPGYVSLFCSRVRVRVVVESVGSD